ncbi:hypothetical protein BN1723_000814 [Verticillium longisporum]|uniref:Uncharacterized protein n=1 Tax=Verticillium longisporum TaxID=100787 RepID=A0A0G4KDB3_VERLO|nr:hypothetical protein BN1708_009056 [Verticillium longisporum]CRK42405.1 hypothetical protein BN1723_000814 [Verticillium longisporum]
MERDTTLRPGEVVLTDRSSAESNHLIIASGQEHSMLQLKIQLQRVSHQPSHTSSHKMSPGATDRKPEERWTVGLRNMAPSRLRDRLQPRSHSWLFRDTSFSLCDMWSRRRLESSTTNTAWKRIRRVGATSARVRDIGSPDDQGSPSRAGSPQHPHSAAARKVQMQATMAMPTGRCYVTVCEWRRGKETVGVRTTVSTRHGSPELVSSAAQPQAHQRTQRLDIRPCGAVPRLGRVRLPGGAEPTRSAEGCTQRPQTRVKIATPGGLPSGLLARWSRCLSFPHVLSLSQPGVALAVESTEDHRGHS